LIKRPFFDRAFVLFLTVPDLALLNRLETNCEYFPTNVMGLQNHWTQSKREQFANDRKRPMNPRGV